MSSLNIKVELNYTRPLLRCGRRRTAPLCPCGRDAALVEPDYLLALGPTTRRVKCSLPTGLFSGALALPSQPLHSAHWHLYLRRRATRGAVVPRRTGARSPSSGATARCARGAGSGGVSLGRGANRPVASRRRRDAARPSACTCAGRRRRGPSSLPCRWAARRASRSWAASPSPAPLRRAPPRWPRRTPRRLRLSASTHVPLRCRCRKKNMVVGFNLHSLNTS